MKRHLQKPLVQWALLGVLMLSLGYSGASISFSCHLCRNIQTRDEVQLFRWTLLSRSRPPRYTVEPSHRHDWYQFSRSQKLGAFGLLGQNIACKTYRFKDDKAS